MTSIMDPKFDPQGKAFKAPAAPIMDNDLRITETIKTSSIKPEFWSPPSVSSTLKGAEVLLANDPFITVEELAEMELRRQSDAKEWAGIDAHIFGDAPVEQKDTTNPKNRLGALKVPLSLVPVAWLAEQSLGYYEGKGKYGEANFRATPIRASVYIDAMLRHISKYIEGQDRDPKTMVHHFANAAACMGIIHDADLMGTLIDDRKMSNPKAIAHIDWLSCVVHNLDQLHKDCKPRHWKIQDSKINEMDDILGE